MTPKNKMIYASALEVGCKPIWHDGIFGWAWHCSCDDNFHGYDSQCSVITLESLARARLQTSVLN